MEIGQGPNWGCSAKKEKKGSCTTRGGPGRNWPELSKEEKTNEGGIVDEVAKMRAGSLA
jgi:hypothetical protein